MCDAMMHALKDSINLKYSELLTKAISKCNLIWKLRNFILYILYQDSPIHPVAVTLIIDETYPS